MRELTLSVIGHEESPFYAKWDEDEVAKDGSAAEGSYTRPLKEPTEVELSIEGTGEIDDREDAVRAALASLPGTDR